MKVAQEFACLVLFLTVEKSAGDCKTFYDKVWKCDADDCFSKESHTIRINYANITAKITCADENSPNMDLMKCSNIRFLEELTFADCTFEDTFLMGDFLDNIHTVRIQIRFERYKETYFYIHFSNMSGSTTIAINRLRILDNFNLTFGEELSSLKIIKIDDHNIREFGIEFPKVSHLFKLTIKNGSLTNLRTLHNVPELNFLDLSWNNISSLGSSLFENVRNLREMNLVGNQLQHLDENLFSGLELLQILLLSKNYLTSIENWIFPPRLTKLQLDNNRLQNLAISLMNAVDSNNYITVTLSNNEWNCDCSVLEWLRRRRSNIGDYQNISCSFTKRDYANFTIELGKSNFDYLCFFPSESNFIPVVIILLLALMVTIFACYYRYTIIALFHDNILAPCFLCMDKPIQEKEFDAFVCCGENNASTSEIFAKELEPRQKLCIPERDWSTEARISSNVAYSIRNSRATLLFVTKNAVAQMWFQVQLRGAYNQRMEDEVHKMILVIGEDLKGATMKEDVRQLIESEPKLIWGERWFWKKLRFQLRRPKRRQ